MPKEVEAKLVPQDQELLNLAKNGDAEAYAQLFEKHRSRLTGYFLLRVGFNLPPYMVEDLIQDVFLTSWRVVVDPETTVKGSYKSWLYGIARHRVLQVVTKEQKILTKPIIEDKTPAETDLMLPSEGQESRFKLEDIATILPPSQRQVFLLRQRGLSVKEVARLLNLSETTVEGRSGRAVRRIEERLLKPNGFIRLSRLSRNNLSLSKACYKAARSGKLPAIRLCSFYYTTSQEFSEFLNVRDQIRNQPRENGLILISSLDLIEHQRLKKNQERWGVIIKQGRLWIKQEDYKRFQLIQGEHLNDFKFQSTHQSLKPIYQLATNYAEYTRLLKAARSSVLSCQKKRRVWFTTQEAVSQFLNSTKPQHQTVS